MEHKIEVSPSGRATCKSCKKAIAKDVLRFGEAFEGNFGDDGVSYRWHHLECAAEKLPALLRPTLAAYDGKVPKRADLEKKIADTLAKGGGGKAPYPHADRAPTGRAKCMVCEEAIEKGAIRVAVEREVDTGSFVTKAPGYLHPGCALEFVEDSGLADPETWRAEIAANTVALKKAELDELLKEIGGE